MLGSAARCYFTGMIIHTHPDAASALACMIAGAYAAERTRNNTCCAGLTSLEPIHCASLVSLPKDIGNLRQLTLLDCEGCRALQSLPDSLSSLQRLQAINMTGCTALQHLPEQISALTALTRLELTRCVSLLDLPEDLTKLTRLRQFSRRGCASLKLSSQFAAWTALLYCQRIEKTFGSSLSHDDG